jgi:adenine-specific DNA methylase
MSGRAFIEVDFPVKEVSAESAREKNIRHGHISTLHIWWARRPLAASRATIYAALTPEPKSEREREERKRFIAELCKWENSNDRELIEKARKDILAANGGAPPKVLDPFAGGGAIPLEALRLGCETYASDLNPVAVLIEKATLEYPQRYGGPVKVKADNLEGEVEVNPLLEDVRRWGEWVLEEAKKELARFYPPDPDGSVPVGYYWMRTVRCQNPQCGTEIPLTANWWLAKKSNKKVALSMLVKSKKKPPAVAFEVVEDGGIDFDPSEGTVSRANVVCPACSSGIDAKALRREAQEGRMGERMVAVVLKHPHRQGKTYRAATEKDMEVFRRAEKALEAKRRKLMEEWGIDPVPDEPTPEGGGPGAERAFSIRGWAMTKWGDLFNPRQKLALITFTDKIKVMGKAYDAANPEAAEAILAYLAIIVDWIADKDSSLTRWDSTRETSKGTFGRQALPMVWDYFELNPFSGSTSDWNSSLEWSLKVIEHCPCGHAEPAEVTQASTTALPHPDRHFDAVITDPPYYDNVPYSYLSDFFYVWLKRTVGDLYPELFSTPLTPKSEEIVAYSHEQGGYEAGKRRFEEMLTRSFQETYRVLKDDGVACIVFAHKSTDAWESVINALLNSGLYLTASWPLNTEMQGRMRAQESAALASSIYMVCRKRKEGKTAYFNEIKAGIEKRIHEKLDQFWEEGIGGSDFFISAIGPAVELFGKYERVEKLSGEQVTVAELLEYVRRVVSEYALSRILDRPQLGGIDVEARFYLLWRWTYNSAKLPFDDARKLSQAVGIELTEYWNKGFVKKEKEFIRVLSAAERGSDFLKQAPENMVDVLHQALLLWSKNDRKGISELLSRTGHVANDDFWRLAQAISEVLPEGDREKQMLQGLLYGKESYGKVTIRGEERGQLQMEE